MDCGHILVGDLLMIHSGGPALYGTAREIAQIVAVCTLELV